MVLNWTCVKVVKSGGVSLPKVVKKMFRVLNPNYKECLFFKKNCLSTLFVCDINSLLLPIKNNVSGSGDPRRGGANSRVQRSPQGRVERSGLFYLFYHTSWRLQRCRRLVCLVDWVVSSFLSFFHRRLPLRLKNSINKMFRSKS